MSKQNDTFAEFTIRRSKKLLLVICVLHVLSLLAIWSIYWPITIKFLLSLLLIVSCLYQYHAYQTTRLFLRYTSNIGWRLYLKNSDRYIDIKIKTSSVVCRLLTVLHVTSEQPQKTFVIFNDAMSDDDYRRFIILLRTTELI